MRRTRRRKYTWFPIIGSAGPGEGGDDFAPEIAQFSVLPDGGTTIAINPLIPDVPLEGNAINTSAPGVLVGALGQEYVIERIVGNAFISYSAPADDDPAAIFAKTVLVGLGIFVARANDNDSGGGVNQPIGSASVQERIQNYSPLSPDTIREPWMWRRTWVLSSGRIGNANDAPPMFGDLQGGNSNHNLQMAGKCGPHFDIKSVRRIRTDERIWLVAAVRTLDQDFIVTTPKPNQTAPNALGLVFDYRVLGALRRAQNRSNF